MKQCLQDMTGLLHWWTHSSCGFLYKTNPVHTQDGEGSGGPIPTHELLVAGACRGGGSWFSSGVWPLAGCLYSSG